APWVRALPDSPPGPPARDAIAAAGVDTTHVRFTEDGRVGLYFVEFGSPPRPTSVWYDRERSAVAEAATFDPAVLDGARYAVLSGITPALSERAAQANLELADAARQTGG